MGGVPGTSAPRYVRVSAPPYNLTTLVGAGVPVSSVKVSFVRIIFVQRIGLCFLSPSTFRRVAGSCCHDYRRAYYSLLKCKTNKIQNIKAYSNYYVVVAK